jgi:hypothetical protein
MVDIVDIDETLGAPVPNMMTSFSICLQKINAQMMLERICIF